MPQVVKIKRGLKVNLPTLAAGEMGFCTDTKEVFIGDGATNNFVGRAMMGTYASRPSAASAGRLYYVNSGTNLGYIYLDDGSAWQRVNVISLADLTGNLDNVADGTTYGKVKNTELTIGQVNRINDGTNVVTAAAALTHINDATKHRLINDAGTAATDLWSAQQINNAIELAKHNIEPQASVKDQNLATPPGSPALADRYIIPASPTGAWVGQTNNIAEWSGSAWVFYVPSVGWNLFVDDELKMYGWSGTAWVRTGGALQTITAGSGLTGGGQADTVTLNVGAGNGITVAADTVSATAYNGITVSASGIAANIDASSIVYDAANGNRLMVSTVDGGTF
ncbi:DUF2793 domain-containing protein [Desulfosporosinus sp. Sb-LF]|uniref:DUF2793 domain-containing protein n=1 Tax=Desulfosporosinus sp. Sb-LF TaxID=2560027 RepID=UPI00107F2738|nr:DUF2793 domain-containing protein [Desulfosporosinus sp. Sb-LF]TGE33315.1 DUF2793 domain-containing protein [Desulfosporosinus sp. Sb-LF]